MSNESLLKKEFKESDVQRVRNIVNKDYTASTKQLSGYQKKLEKHSEGDIWEENGKTWTIKNGLKQNITKLDAAKKALQVPLTCPKCGGPMKHWLAKKMYKIHGFCFDPCTVNYEHELKKAGLYEQYEKQMMYGNIKAFAKEIEDWITESLSNSITMVTEQGDVESWSDMSNNRKNEITKNLQEYLKVIREHVD
jgi:hypothetical protein